MSSVQTQRRSMHSRSRPLHGSSARRRNGHHFSGVIGLGLRTAGFIGRGPKELCPYVLPWVFAFLAIAFFCLVLRGVLTQQLLVPPVEAPQSLVTRGYTSNFLAERIMSAMRQIGRDAESIPHDTMADNDAQPDIQLPGQDMSYASTVRFIKCIVKRKDVVVHVGIARLDDGADSYVAHVQIEGGPFDSRESTVRFEGSDLKTFVHDIAVKAMRLAEPNILASHLFSEVQKTKCSLAHCNYGDIVSIYDEVLAMPASEQSEWALAGKSWLLASQGLAKEAEQQAREALTIYKDSAILRASLGIALEQQHRLDDALDTLRAAAKSKATTAENLRLLGDVSLHSGRYVEALDAFRQAYRMKPDSVDNLHDWGEALIAIGKYDEAIEKLSRAVSLRPDLAPSYAEWGRALNKKGDLSGAASKFTQAFRLDPGALSARETRIAQFGAAFQDRNNAGQAKHDARVRPALNPPADYRLEASRPASRDVGPNAMPIA
ncbi:tetratricopeptide repeat protein [Paraburkholderia kirstenboschensis]|uniref:Tetratricopeptide repeat protein n=1 Tax=Paraburkholderia kirstenboschensis TaxID=1245436 RepID=A0ABZ0EJR4_9BURK|nr:tetratricopeptide repeat protein [Paraburkholderia kirstenboschensis]WOD16814.1 tetratricopeptide repeat protein [Paraburkholderia kirstenboschensis]